MAARVPAVMVQATGSHAGKSTLVAGLGRLFARRGLAVRPFKPQNMSNNAAVTADGGEIGRAQALQARACRVPPSRYMNPVLLKPESDTGAQVVVQGRVVGRYGARAFGDLKPTLLPAVLESFAHVADGADLVLVEGAGSPAEANLRAGDIANMGFALAAKVPVVLLGDIDRGGAIAALVGTWQLLEPAERALVRGYVVNKFRGDPSLFDGAHGIIRAHTGLGSLGVVPWCSAAGRLPAEDVLGLGDGSDARTDDRPIRIAVPRLSRSANFDDLDPLRAEPDVAVVVVPPGRALPGDADLVLLTGSKATIADLAFLRAQGWDIDLQAHVRRGGRVLGICGGYQMLGRGVADPAGAEGSAGEAAGLGLLDVTTELAPEKTVRPAAGVALTSGRPVAGYEIHLGVTTGPDTARPLLRLDDRDDGAVSPDGRIAGCYLHGLFTADGFRHAFLATLRPRTDSGLRFEPSVDAALDALADHLQACLDIDRLLRIAAARRAG